MTGRRVLRFIYYCCYFPVEFRNLNASIVIESSHPEGEAVYILTTKSPYLITSAITLSAESKYFELDRVYNSKYNNLFQYIVCFFLKNHKKSLVSKDSGFCFFFGRLEIPVLQFEKNCTQNPYFLQKFDFCIFEPKNCELIENSPKAP